MISTCRHSARHSTRGFDLSSHRSGTVVTPHGAAAARSVRHCRRSARRLLLALALSACACCDVVTAYGTAAAVGTRSVRHFRRSARRLRSWRLRSRRTRGCELPLLARFGTAGAQLGACYWRLRSRRARVAMSSPRTALPPLLVLARFGTSGAQLGACALGACALGVRVVVTTTAVGDLSLWHCRHSARRCRCLVRHLRSWRLRSRRTRVATATAVGDLSLWSALSSPRTALYAWLRRPLPSHRSMLPPLRSTLTYCSRHLLTAVAPHGVYRSGRHCRHSVRHCRRCWYCRVLARFGTAGTQLGALACLRSLRLLALLAFVRVLRRPCDVR